MKINEVVSSEIEDFTNSLKEKYDLKSLSMFLNNKGDLYLNLIAVKKENLGKGIGTKVLQEIAKFADENSLKITLTTGTKDPYFGTTSQSRLIKFYKRFGFVENKGRNKDFSISGNMYRNPKGQ